MLNFTKNYYGLLIARFSIVKKGRIKMKKVLCTILAACTISSNALAAANISVNGNKITAEVDIDAGKWGTLIVTKAGKSLDNENIIAMKQAFADENGKAIFKFSMPEELEGGVNGEYDLHIKNGDGDIYIENMYYILPSDREGVIDSLKNSEDIKTILEDEKSKEVLSSLGAHLDIYGEFAKIDEENGNGDLTESVCKTLKEALTEDMSETEVVDLLNNTLIVQAINVLPEEKAEIIEKLGYSFEEVKYEDAQIDTKNFVCEYIYSNKPYSNIEEIKKAYDTANMLSVINSTRFDAMESKLTGYAAALGITEDEAYKSYVNASNKTAINEDIVVALKNKKAVTVKELIAVIDKAIKDNTSGGNAGGSGGGGGGAGGGGGKVSSETLDKTSNPLASIPVVNDRKEFKDIESVLWAKTAISSMAEKGIVAGDENGNFNPNNSVKREEFVKMLVVAAGVHNEKAKCDFNDVVKDAWYSSYVASAFDSKLVYGISEDSFGVGTNITRQDMAVMCYRAAQSVNKLAKVRDGVQFADGEKISDYAKDAVAKLYEAGAINGIGDNLFDPTGTATRAQAAVMIYNVFVK